jgi:hypothetical protein
VNLRPVPLFGIGNQGKSPNVNAQSRKNLYIEVQQDAEKHVLTMYPTPGLITFVNFGETPIRGTYEMGDLMYVVHRNTLYSIAADGTMVSRGTLVTYSGPVSFTDNGSQIALVDGPNGYVYVPATTTFTQIASVGFVGGDKIRFLNGRFIANRPGTGEFCWSDQYDGLSWDVLDFATAEADPDDVVSLEVENGQLCLFGDKVTEFWGDSGAADLPYARIGSSAIEWGLAAPLSLCKFMDSLIFLRKNRLGQVQVCVQSGASAAAVSNPEIDYEFSTYDAVSDATGFAYMLSGHPFYQINFPTANKSWLYDGQSKAWSELESGGGRHRAELHQQFQNQSYVSDYETGKLYLLREDVYTDDGATIVREFTGRHQSNGNMQSMSELWLEMEAGVGLQVGQGANPQVMLQISKDGGHEFGAEMWREFGAAGKYTARAKWNRLGQARDWLFRFKVTDPVRTVFIAAWGR